MSEGKSGRDGTRKVDMTDRVSSSIEVRKGLVSISIADSLLVGNYGEDSLFLYKWHTLTFRL